ncbi:tetratricopeptide repeat protein, partial [bacterium]|nr:tetratricopeptide repeat protein [bacterium]
KNLFNENMPILPRGGGGHVLITSRYHNWDEWCEHAVVKKFAADESLAFLLKRTRQKDRKTAEKLAEQVGHLPLALAQAAAYIRKQEIKLADYLELFNQERDKLWTIENAPRNYPYTIATTWKIAMARIRLESSAAVNLLNFISIHAPDDIPIALLLKNEKLRSGKIAIEATNRQAVASIRKMTLRRFSQRLRNRLTQSGQTPLISLVNNAKDDFVYQDAIIALKSYSLVEGNLDSLSVHNLVQMVTRDNLEKESNREWCEIALTLMDSVFPAKSGEAKNWPLCSQLFPHAIAVSNLAELFNVLPKLNLSLLFKLGEYLSDSAQYEKAEAIYRQTLKIARKVHPDKHAELSHIHRAIGLSLEARDFYEAAYKQYKKALEIDKRLHGDKGAEIAVDQSHLGAVSLKWGKLDDALAYYQNALKNNYNAYNERHPVVIINRNNLGKTFSARGHFELAENHFDHALEMAKGYFGHNHPFVAEVINNLGDLRLLKGNLAEAKTDFEFALEIHQNTFGDEHPRVAEDLNRIGTVLMLQSDPRGAENLFTQALEINREIYGNQHHAIARDINSLGCLEKKKGNLPAAIDFFKQALAISKSVFKTTHHPFIAEIANNYGTARLEQADYEEARKYIELALSIHRKSYRPNHPIVARGLISLARVYHLENKLEQAKKNYFIAYDILANRFVKNHPDLIELRTNLLKLADDYNGLSVGQNRKSDNLYCPQAVTIYRKLDLMATK